MDLKNTTKYHLLLGAIIVGMHILDEYNKMGEKVFADELGLGMLYLTTFNIAFFGTYAFNYRVICPKTLAKKKVLLFIIGVVSLFFVFAAIRFFLEEIVVYNLLGFHNYSDRTRRFWFYIFDNSYYALKAGLFSGFMYFLFNYLRSISRLHELQLAHQRTQLDALKSQLEPHFLFNILNTFYSELQETQPSTASGIYKLSELLRYLTYESKPDFVRLEREISFVENYIYLYRKRFEKNLALTLNIDIRDTNSFVPSLIFTHFIENIFKHGVVQDKNHPAFIGVTTENGFLELRTNNKIAAVDGGRSAGIGKENLVKRLQLLYSGNFVFETKSDSISYNTYLKIPLR